MPQEWSGQIGDEQGAVAEASSQNLSGTKKGSILHTHPHGLGWMLSCRQQAWRDCCCPLVCSPSCAPWTPWQPELSQGPLLQGATVGFRETPGASHAMRVVLCPLMILTQRIGSPPPSTLPAVTAGVVQEDCPFLPAFSICPWTCEAH